MQLVKYQCRRCRYVFVQLHAAGDGQAAACPRCHREDLVRQADFAATPLSVLGKAKMPSDIGAKKSYAGSNIEQG